MINYRALLLFILGIYFVVSMALTADIFRKTEHDNTRARYSEAMCSWGIVAKCEGKTFCCSRYNNYFVYECDNYPCQNITEKLKELNDLPLTVDEIRYEVIAVFALHLGGFVALIIGVVRQKIRERVALPDSIELKD